MASIKAILKINDIGNGEISTIVSDKATNNISLIPYETNFNYREDYKSTMNYAGSFVLGYSTLNGGDKIIEQVNEGFVTPPADTLEVDITGDNIIKLTWQFESNNVPTDCVVTDYDGSVKTISFNNVVDGMCVIEGLVAGSGTKTFLFRGFNSQKLINLKYLESISVNIELDKYFIKHLESEIQMTPSANKISYGIYASSGKLELNDYNVTLLTKAQMGYLDTNTYNAYVYVNGKQIAFHTSYDAPMISATKEITLNITDIIDKFKTTVVEAKAYNVGENLWNILIDNLDREFSERTTFIKNDSEQINIGNNTYMTIKNYLLNIKLRTNYNRNDVSQDNQHFYMAKTNLYDLITAICNIAQLNCCLNDDGQLKFFNGRPLLNKNEIDKAIVIPRKYQRTSLTYDIIITNKYNNVIIE